LTEVRRIVKFWNDGVQYSSVRGGFGFLIIMYSQYGYPSDTTQKESGVGGGAG